MGGIQALRSAPSRRCIHRNGGTIQSSPGHIASRCAGIWIVIGISGGYGSHPCSSLTLADGTPQTENFKRFRVGFSSVRLGLEKGTEPRWMSNIAAISRLFADDAYWIVVRDIRRICCFGTKRASHFRLPHTQEMDSPEEYSATKAKMESHGWSFKPAFYWANAAGKKTPPTDAPWMQMRTFMIAFRGDVGELLYSNRQGLGASARFNYVVASSRRIGPYAQDPKNPTTPVVVYWHLMLLVSNHREHTRTHTLVIGECVRAENLSAGYGPDCCLS